MCDRQWLGFDRSPPPKEKHPVSTQAFSVRRCVCCRPRRCILREKARCSPAPRRIARREAGRVAGLLARSAEYLSRCLSPPREIPSPHAGSIAFAQPWNVCSSSFERQNDCRCESGQRTPLDHRRFPGPSSTTPGCQRRRDYVPARRRKNAPRASTVACPRSPREGPARGATRPVRGWRRPARGWGLWAHGDKGGGLFGRALASRSALPEPVALAVHLQDMDMVGDAVEQRAGEALAGEHRRPFLEGQV